MRLKRPSQPTAAIRCPSCRTIFEVKSSELQDEPIVAEIVDEVPLEAIIMDEPLSETQANFGSGAAAVIVDIDDFEAPAAVTNLSVANPPPPRNRATAAKATPNAIHNAPSQSSLLKNKKVLVGIVGGSTLLVAMLGLIVLKFLFASDRSESAVVLDRYQEALTSAKDSLTQLSSKPDTALINAEVDRMQRALVEIVRSPIFEDSQEKEFRAKVESLSGLSREVKRICTLMPLAASNGTKVEQMPIMIDLIEKQLNYGQRKVVDNKERPNRFLIEAFEHFRALDRNLAQTLKDGTAPDLNSLGSTLDKLDEACVRYGEAALDRFEMTFEQKQIFECGDSFRRWSLNQLSQAGHENPCTALGKEIEAEKRRFDQALRATRLDNLTLSGVDRINKRMSEPTGTLFAKDSKSSNDAKSNANVDTIPNRTESNRSGVGSASSQGSTELANSNVAGSDQFAKSSNEVSSSQSNPINGVFGANSNLNSNRSSNDQKMNSGRSTLGNSDEGKSAPVDLNQAQIFPAPRYWNADSLVLKVITRKSKVEIEQIAKQLSSKLNAGVADVQKSGDLVTISFSLYRSKPSAAVGAINFGKVEICDSQSRTLFVNDYE